VEYAISTLNIKSSVHSKYAVLKKIYKEYMFSRCPGFEGRSDWGDNQTVRV
jgi:hypothetical protein